MAQTQVAQTQMAQIQMAQIQMAQIQASQTHQAEIRPVELDHHDHDTDDRQSIRDLTKSFGGGAQLAARDFSAARKCPSKRIF
jgi:hypothetical protein